MTREPSPGAAPARQPSTHATGGAPSRWFLRPGATDTAGIRLFCFPSAGFGAAMYGSWIRAAAGRLDVYPVQLPGRANRLADPPLASIHTLADRLLPEIAPLTDRPYAMFGHSMGAVLAAFTAQAIAAEGLPGPEHLFLSARQPPDCPSPVPPLSHLDDQAFVTEINSRYGGIPQEILREPDVMAMLLPALRADVQALEALEGHPSHRLDAPITAYGGADDALVPRALLEQWEGWTAGDFRLRMFPGGHFYIDDALQDVLRDISETLKVAGANGGA